MACVNTKSRDFKFLAEANKVSVNTLELITHKYWIEAGSDQGFPTSVYIQAQLGGIPYRESSKDVRELWQKSYSSPQQFNTIEQAQRAQRKARKFFPPKAVVVYESNKGWTLAVRKPVKKLEYDIESVYKAPFYTLQDYDDYDRVADMLAEEDGADGEFAKEVNKRRDAFGKSKEMPIFASRRVLSEKAEQAIRTGNWTTETIEEFNNILNEIQNGKIRFQRTLEEREPFTDGISQIHAGASIIAGGNYGASQEESRNPQEEFRKDAEQGREQERRIEAWAKANDLWLNDYTDEEGNKANTLEDLIESQWPYFDEGSEAKAYMYDENTLLKSISLSHSNDNVAKLLDKIALFNKLFPETAMNIVGFGRDALGHFRIIVLQNFVQGDELTTEEHKEFLKKYPEINSGGNIETEEALISDLGEYNILKDDKGNYFVIDADVVFKTPAKGGNITFTNSLSYSDQQTQSQFPNEIQFAVESTVPGPETKINIYAGTNENADLSNFAERPFNPRDAIFIAESYMGRMLSPEYKEALERVGTFKTVEGAFQALKIFFSSHPYTGKKLGDRPVSKEGYEVLKKLANANGAEAKRIGRSIKGLNVNAWDRVSNTYMKVLIKGSFEHNPQAMQRLLATGNATLTHTQDKGKWGKEFPRILMEVREELRKAHPELAPVQPQSSLDKELTQQTLDKLEEIFKDSDIVNYEEELEKYLEEHSLSSVQQAVETPSPEEQIRWIDQNKEKLISDYLAEYPNIWNPDDVRNLLAPLGYNKLNTTEFIAAGRYLARIIQQRMWDDFSKSDNKTVVILTGTPGSGKSSATENRKEELNKKGLVLDAPFHTIEDLQKVIDRARELGAKDEDIQVIAVYNDLYTTYENTLKRGNETQRYIPLKYFLESYTKNIGKIKTLIDNNPTIDIVTIDNSNNQGRECTHEEAVNWDYTISEEQIEHLINQINENEKVNDEKRSELLSEVNVRELAERNRRNQESWRRGLEQNDGGEIRTSSRPELEDTTQQFTTPQGEVYGFVDKNDKIYLDRRVIRAEHPIHEYTHLWDRYVAKRNPRFWKAGITIFKQTSEWQKVLNDPNYGQKWKDMGMSGFQFDSMIASEVHSRLTGKRGKELLEQIAKEKGSKGIYRKLKQWLFDFWKTIKSAFSPWNDEQLQRLNALAEKDLDKAIQYLSDMTLKDFAEGVNPITTSLFQGVTAKQVQEAKDALNYRIQNLRGRIESFEEQARAGYAKKEQIAELPALRLELAEKESLLNGLNTGESEVIINPYGVPEIRKTQGQQSQQPAQEAQPQPIIQQFQGEWTRTSVENDSETLYVFTDNTDRTSGSGRIPDDSWYSKKYGKGYHYPTKTTARIRGLDNARPVSTVRFFYSKHKGMTHPQYDRTSKALWHDSDFDEFKIVIDNEFKEILKAWKSGKYKRIMFPSGDGLFNAKISDISETRTPKLYAYLQQKYQELQSQVNGTQEQNTNAASESQDSNLENIEDAETWKAAAALPKPIGRRSIKYTPIGKETQTYEVEGDYIFNKKGITVFNKDSKDRRRIFANLAYQEGRAVIVEHRGRKYVVNNKREIVSVQTGDMMQWGEENGDRKAILKNAAQKFKEKLAAMPKPQEQPQETKQAPEQPVSNNVSYNNKTAPFTIDLLGDKVQVNSLEQAFALNKLFTMFDEMEEEDFNEWERKLMNASPSEAVELGKRIPMSAAGNRRWNDNKKDIWEDLKATAAKQAQQKQQAAQKEEHDSIIQQALDHLKAMGIKVHTRDELIEYLKKNHINDMLRAVEQQKEMDEIKAKAQANGTFMLAPNGKPTNLNERQWLQVRTKAFKEWFGDWKNDFTNASKVVDENGEPLVVYHSNWVNPENTDWAKSNNQQFIDNIVETQVDGIARTFFTTAKYLDYSRQFGNNTQAYFLNIRNPHEYSRENTKYYHRGDWGTGNIEMGLLQEDGYDGALAWKGKRDEYVVATPNQVKSATDNNGMFSTENDDIQMAIGKKSPEYITDTLSDSEKDDIRTALRKINKAGRTLVDTGEGLYLVDHTDKEGIDNRKDNQEGFQCVAKIDTEGLSKQQINDIKDGYEKAEKTSRGFDDWLEANGYSDRLSNSDSIDAEVRESNIDNAGLDQETLQGESFGESGFSNSQENQGKGTRLIKTGADGIVFPRAIETPDVMRYTTPDGEVYGFVDPKTGEMYLDETVIKLEHPVHEYTHLWDKALAEKNPELWKQGVSLMKQLSLWQKIENDPNYGQLWKAKGREGEELEFLIASEVHARLVGKQGAKFLEEMSKQAGQKGLFAKLKKWLEKVWKDLANSFGYWSKEDLESLTLEDFNKLTVRDFVYGINPNTVEALSQATGNAEINEQDSRLLDSEEENPEPMTEQEKLTITQKKLTEYQKVNQQMLNLYDNEVGLGMEEVRHVAEVAVNAISDFITKLQKKPELAEKWFPNQKFDIDFQKASRREIVNAVGINNLIAMAKANIAPKNARYKDTKTVEQAFLLMKNWDAVMFLAMDAFAANEGFGLRKNYIKGTFSITEGSDNTYDGTEQYNDEDSVAEREGDPQEHWQVEMRTIDVLNSMTEKVRIAIHQCHVMDRDGKAKYSKWGKGIPERVDARKAVQSILRWTQGAKDIKEMVAKLEEKAKIPNNKWLEQLIKRLKDESGREVDFQSQFYTTMCKDFQLYSVGVKDKNGKIYTKVMNKQPALKRIMNTIKTMQMIGSHPLFTADNKINKSALGDIYDAGGYKVQNESQFFKRQAKTPDNPNVKQALERNIPQNKITLSSASQELQAILINTPSDSEISSEHMEKAIVNVLAVCNILGYPITKEMLEDNGLMTRENLDIVVHNLMGIVINLHKVDESKGYNPFGYEDSKERSENSGLGIGGYVGKLLAPFTDSLEDSEINAFYEDGNMYQSFVTPSFLTMFVSKIKYMTKEERETFFNENYGFSEFFYKNGQWRNTLMRDLANPWGKTQKIFDHKVQLTFNKHGYMRNMSPEEYTLSVLTEYFAEKNKEEGFAKGVWPAWFRMPIQSNKPSSEFICMPSYRDMEEYDSVPKYKTDIVKQLKEIIFMEMDRIQTTRMRNEEKDGLELINQFDKNGQNFCFFPFLNIYINSNGGTLLSKDGKVSARDKQLAKFLKNKIEGKELSVEDEAKLGLLLDEAVLNYMQGRADKILAEWENKGITKAAKNLHNIGSESSIEQQLENFIWNDFLATKNILLLTVGDISCYKNAEDLQKRLAQLHAPGLRPNIWATDYGVEATETQEGREPKRVSDGTYRTVILKDFDDFVSNVIANLNEVFDRRIAAASDEEKAAIRALKDALLRPRTYNPDGSIKDKGGAYWNINVADAQGYSSPSSYRKKALMFGKWSEEAERIYQKIKNHEPVTIAEITTAFQPMKPFVYGMLHKEMRVENAPIQNMGIPFQAKNAEYLLIMADAIIQEEERNSGKLGRPNILKAIYDVMEESEERNPGKGIDTIQFESAIKSGKQGVIDLNQFMDDPDGEAKAHAYLTNKLYATETVQVKNEKGETETRERLSKDYDKEICHELPYERYCLQQEVPAHFQNHFQSQGSQERMLLPADLDDYYNPNGDLEDENNIIRYEITELNGEVKRLKASELREEYEKTIAANIEQSLDELRSALHLEPPSENDSDEEAREKRKRNNIALSEYLQKEIAGSPRYGADLFTACSVDENGEFQVPKGDPIQSKRVEQLINSLIKNRVNKQEVAGGPIVQVSNFGTSKQLHIRFNDKKHGGLLVLEEQWTNGTAPKALYEKYPSYEAYCKECQGGIAHFEVFAPAWSKEILKKFMDKDGHLDIQMLEMLHPDLLKLLSYRIPTEYKYSMAPMKIVGFMPAWAGDAIMFPYEQTEIDDSDFDVDKRYVMRKEIDIKPMFEGSEKYFIDTHKKELIEHITSKIGLPKNVPAKKIEEIKEKEKANTELRKRAAEREHIQRVNKIEDRYDLAEDINAEAEYNEKDKEKDNKAYEKVDEWQEKSYKRALEKEEKRYKEQIEQIEKEEQGNIEKAIEKLKKQKAKERIIQFFEVERWMNSNTDDALTRAIRKAYVEYAFKIEMPTLETKPRAFRNNRVFDLSMAVLTHETSADKIMNPGGFEEPKRIAYAIAALKNPNVNLSWEELMNMKTDELSKLYYTEKDLAWIDAQVEFYKQNSAAASLIGVFAVNNIAHATLGDDHFILAVDEILKKLGSVTIAGKDFWGDMQIDPKKSDDGKYISKTLGSMVSASADAAKDPILNLINVNMATAGTFSTMLRLGMPFEDAALFLAQDAITRVLDDFNKKNLEGYVTLDDVLQEHITRMKRKHKFTKGSTINFEELTKNELFEGLKPREEVAEEDIEEENRQRDVIDYKVLTALQKIMKLTTPMRNLTAVTRLNSVSSAVGPLIVDNLILEHKLNKFKGGGEISTHVYTNNGRMVTIDVVLERHPILAGFHKTIKLAKDMMYDMPAYNEQFKELISTQVKDAYGDEVAGYEDIFYEDKKLLTKLLDFYLSHLLVNSGMIDFSDLEYYLNEFPKEFVDKKYKDKYKDNSLIQAIELDTTEKSQRAFLHINITGMDGNVSERLKSAWVDLYKENPDLAVKLFQYCFFRAGIGFSPKSFMTLVPAYLKMKMEKTLADGTKTSYVDTFRKCPYVNLDLVLDQFIRNNWNNSKLVPKKELDKLGNLNVDTERFLIAGSNEKEEMEKVPYFKAYVKDKGMWLFRQAGYDSKGNLVYARVMPLGNNGEYVEIDKKYIAQSFTETTSINSTESGNEGKEQSPTQDTMESSTKDVEDAIEQIKEIGGLVKVFMNDGNRTESEAKAVIQKIKNMPVEPEAYLKEVFMKQRININKAKAMEIFKKMC